VKRRTWKRTNISLKLIPVIYFVEFPKQDTAYGRYNFYRSEIRIRKELSWKWKAVVLIHELGHHAISLLWGLPLEKWAEKTVWYEQLWFPVFFKIPLVCAKILARNGSGDEKKKEV